MFIWHVSRPDAADWDEYISFVAVAPDEATVRGMHPSGDATYFWSEAAGGWMVGDFPDQWSLQYSSWIPPRDAVVKVIGVAHDITPRIILSDFKAG